MNNTSETILERFWGFKAFRPLQKDIIDSVINGKDTLALLPTGGGKSICYQVPAIQLQGVAIVVSPLIALMKDQVINLRKRGVQATALISGMSYREIDLAVNNCKNGKYKLLYLSPERLRSEDMRERLSYLDISFIAVDEAHCISQWGYDFRPPYLKIAEFRKLHPKAPVMALTATATPKVVDDITEKLEFQKGKIFKKSFARGNLAYKVFFEEDKWNRLVKLLDRSDGSAIIYTRSRRLTGDITRFLQQHRISADFYHAGLSASDRDTRQQSWQLGKTRVMVATNAFGMGIDKPDVRLVAHLHIPDNIESYFQEAGRAGRDEKYAEAVALFENKDIVLLEKRAEQAFPPKDVIKSVYTALGNYFQLPTGGGLDESFDFDLPAFARRFQFKPVEVYNAIKILEKDEYVSLTDSVVLQNRLMITCSYRELYEYQVKNNELDNFLKFLLRSYTGLFDHYVKIDTNKIARHLKIDIKRLNSIFQYMEKLKLISYLPATSKPQLVFTSERIPTKNLNISKESYELRKKDHEERTAAIINYLTNDRVCRNVQLLDYFGEKDAKPCGQCDVCTAKKGMDFGQEEVDVLLNEIQMYTLEKPVNIQELIKKLNRHDDEQVIEKVTWLIENGKVEYDQQQRVKWRENQ